MANQKGNLHLSERAGSALLGIGFSVLAFTPRHPVLRAVYGLMAGGLFARAAAGHCGVKSVLRGDATLTEGIKDQWRGMASHPGASVEGLPGSPLREQRTQAVDESVSESFPASDPPASRLPDEPPVNADAKWAAARAAQKAPS